LNGLADDDHTQYALLAGRSVGQILKGGTAASETLTLQSTANATKGKVILGAAGASAYDEVNERLGVGTASPSYTIQAYNATASTIYSTSDTSNTGVAGIGSIANGCISNLICYGSSVAGTVAGYNYADLVRLYASNATNFLIGTNNTSPIILASNASARIVIGGTGTINLPDATASRVISTDASKNLQYIQIDHAGAMMTNINSATYTHLTSTNHTDLTDGGNTTLHVHTRYADVAQEAWTASSFAGTWADYGGSYDAAGYFKDTVGIVHLRGLVKSGGAFPSTIFTLPAGYRPNGHQSFSVPSYIGGADSGAGVVIVQSDGLVRASVGSDTYIGLNGISFRAA
jgi:hypothetical protein